jgi:transcriptional regulator with XRE-family HTH domain
MAEKKQRRSYSRNGIYLDFEARQVLKKTRVAKGFSQKKFAAVVGVGYSTIVNIECGLRRPTKEMLNKITIRLDLIWEMPTVVFYRLRKNQPHPLNRPGKGRGTIRKDGWPAGLSPRSQNNQTAINKARKLASLGPPPRKQQPTASDPGQPPRRPPRKTPAPPPDAGAESASTAGGEEQLSISHQPDLSEM